MNRKIILHRMRRNPFFMVGLIVCLFLLVSLFLLPLLVKFDPAANSLLERFGKPDWFSKGFKGHIFGCDQMGRDVLARLLLGGKISIAISFAVVLIQVVFGTVMGVLAGYYGGWVDSVIMRACDVVLSIPNLILALAIMAVLGNTVPNLIAVLSFSGWVQFCKLTRNNVKVAAIWNMSMPRRRSAQKAPTSCSVRFSRTLRRTLSFWPRSASAGSSCSSPL